MSCDPKITPKSASSVGAGAGRGNVNPPMAIPELGYKPDSLRGSNDVVPDAFSHTQTTPPPFPNSATDIKIAFQPNILDNYNAFTYHWKLFITPLSAATSGKVLTPSAQTIIAESGVTDLTIDKVELNGIAVPSVETGTGTQTTIKFEILEPSGAGLLDKLFYESVSLGIGNWLVMPCFLQLEFRSRDPLSSEAVSNGAPGKLGTLNWVWPIKLTNAKANVTTVGTRYDFEAVVYDELAQSNSYFSVQHNVALTGLTTFGEAMKDLKRKLNADAYEKLLDNYSIPDVYDIVVDGALENIILAQPDANKSTSRAGDFIDFDKKSAAYNTGTSIDKIVDSLLGSSKHFQKAMQSSATSSSEPNTAANAKPMRDFWRIVTETKPIGYDALRQDNAVQITIYIVKYDLGLLEATPAQTGQTPDTANAAKARLATYSNNGILKKKYNYIFTGQNDQVISFDLNMNFSFAASLSRFGGVYIDTAMSDKGVTQQENSKNEQEATNKIRQYLSYINSAASDESYNDASDILLSSTQKALEAIKLDPVVKARYSTLLANAKPQDRTTYVNRVIAAGGANADGTVDERLSDEKSRAKSLAEEINGLKFISDINIYSESAQTARKIAEASRRGKLRPIPFREGAQETNLAFGIDPASDAGRSRTASLFSTALYSSLDASLQQIKMTIKGDPFWLFPNNLSGNPQVLPYKSNMSPSKAIEFIKTGHRSQYDSVNLFGTDNFIVVRFRTPRIYNTTTGLNDPYTEVETFSGVYRVITIVSKFEHGKFTQELTCILDNLINLSDFPQFLRDIEIENGAPLRPEDSLSPGETILRDKAKEPRIMGDFNPKGVADPINRATASIGSIADRARASLPSSQGFSAAELLKRIPTVG